MKLSVHSVGSHRAATPGEQRQFTPCCLVALSQVFCGPLDAPRGQHLSLDSHLAFAVSADTIRALDVVKQKSFAQNLVVSSRL